MNPVSEYTQTIFTFIACCMALIGSMFSISCGFGDEPVDKPDEGKSVYSDSSSKHGAHESSWPVWAIDGQLENGVLLLHVVTDQFLDPAAAKVDLQEKMAERVAMEIDRWIRPGAGELLNIDWRFIDENLRVKDKTEIIEQDFPYGAKLGEKFKINDNFKTMYVGHTQLKLDQQFRSRVLERWKKHETGSRLLQTSLIGGVLLLALVSVSGFLRLDHATRGFYTRRLFFMTLFILMMGGLTAYYFGCRFPWL